MTKDDEMFAPVLPSDEVMRFLAENPGANWEDSLMYFVDRYPQIEDTKVQWIVEGGAAVRLHNQTRRTPNDIDIITRKSEVKDEFANAKGFDIKTVEDWFTLRGLDYTEEKGEILFSNVTTTELHGKQLLILNPPALVVSKTISTHRFAPQRPEDQADIDLLSANSQAVQSLIQSITARL